MRVPEIFEVYQQSISLKEIEHFPNTSTEYREKKKVLGSRVLSGYFGILSLCFILWAFWSLSECEAFVFLEKNCQINIGITDEISLLYHFSPFFVKTKIISYGKLSSEGLHRKQVYFVF